MNRKILKITIIAILLLYICSNIVNALSFTATMTPSSKVVPPSTEFTVEIKVSNLDVGKNGINSLSGYLKYDEAVFEKISESSIEGRNGWNHSYNADNGGKITLTKTTFVNSEEDVFQITLKTKPEMYLDPNNLVGEIQFTNIIASNSAAEISALDISADISVENGDGSSGSESENNGSNGTGNNGSNGSGSENNGSSGSGSENNGSSGNGTENNGSSGNGSENNGSNGTGNNGSSGNGSENNGSNGSNSNGTIQITPNVNNNNTSNSNNASLSITPTSNTNTNKNTNTNTNSNTNKVISYSNSSNTTDESIPYTGAEDTIMYLIGAIIIIAIVFYIKFEKINKEIK